MSGLKLKVVPQFPAQVLSGPGVDVTKANGNYTFSLDYSDFPQISVLPTDLTYALIYDPITHLYVQAPVSLLGGGGGGLADAPNDGTTYGRNSAAWVHVLALSGGALTGPLTLAADPATALGAATKQYVDAHGGGFPDAPSNGNTYGRLNGTWAQVLPVTGGTLSGPLSLNADPTIPLGAATKQYVDAHSGSGGPTTLTGDVTGTGTGTVPTTLATVNGNVGTFQGVTVNAKGLVTAAVAMGYLTGNQTITLSGDLTGSGATAITATIANGAVTNAKHANSPAYTFKGNATGAAAAPQDFTIGSLTAKGAPVGADALIIADSAASGALKQVLWSSLPSGGSGPVGHGQCRLDFVSATQIKLSAFNGQNIQIAGAVVQIPGAGITAANTAVFVEGVAAQNLAANTVYNVYLFNNSGTPTIDFSTAARIADATAGNVGVQIKTGDNSRTLVGKIQTNASSQFVSNAVISWFNRRALTVRLTDNVDRNTTTIWTEVVSTLRCNFLSWGGTEDVVRVSYSACLLNATAAANMYIGAGLDGVTGVSGSQSGTENTASAYVSFAMSLSTTIAEGAHYFTLVGGASAGTTVFKGTNVAQAIEVEYRG